MDLSKVREWFRFGQRQEAPPSEPRELQEAAMPVRSIHAPHMLDRAIRAAFELEAVEPGASATVAPAGFFVGVKTEGISLDRESFTRWTVTNTTAQPIAVIAPKELRASPDKITPLAPGETLRGVSALSEIAVGPLRFTLPTLGLLPTKDLEAKAPLITSAPGLSKKSAALKGVFEEFSRAIEALRGDDCETARKMIVKIFERLDFDVDRELFVVMDNSYPGVVHDLLEVSRATGKKGERIFAPLLSTPYDPGKGGSGVSSQEAPLSEELKTLSLCADRIATTTLALWCAKELRHELGGPLTRFVRALPEPGLITPETDAILFLHGLGVPLSPVFFRLSTGRDQAWKIIREMNAGSGGDLGVERAG